jgi:hypothetical protein
MVGQVLIGIRYVNLDYARHQLASPPIGPREVLDEVEWVEPTWRYPDCDSLDFGVELTMTSGRVFTVTWDPPGDREGINIREEDLVGGAVIADANVAVWDVTRRSGWARFVDAAVAQIDMNYRPWGSEGFWCSRVTVYFGAGRVELLLGQGERDRAVSPSADNVAVLFDPVALPAWELRP